MTFDKSPNKTASLDCFFWRNSREQESSFAFSSSVQLCKIELTDVCGCTCSAGSNFQIESAVFIEEIDGTETCIT